MTTAREIITLALKEAGILGVGQTPLAEDINDSFTILQRMTNQWQKRRWLVPSLMDISKPGNSLRSNKIGPGQYYNAPRPDKIQAGYMVQLNTGTTPISLPLFPIFSYEDYVRITVKNLNTLPDHFFYDGANPYGNVFIWPIPNEQYEIHLLIKSNIGFSTTISAGEISNAGSGYVDGAYIAVPLTQISGTGVGTGATADITVAGGVVTVFTLNNGGQGFNINDELSTSNINLGGAGSGFTYTVNNTSSDLDSVIEMPNEYEEAIHYNLSIRLSSLYQLPPLPSTVALAKVALNTIKKSNTQVPQLVMPPGLRTPKAFNIFNPDGYGY